jgi:hypothetical protein
MENGQRSSADLSPKRPEVLGHFRGDLTPPGTRYRPLGIHTVDQIPGDPANETSGLPELAAALAVLGIGEAEGEWRVERADPAVVGSGSLLVTPDGGKPPQRIFFAANAEAALQLHLAGAVGDNDSDAIIVFSTAPEARPARSPSAPLGRTGEPFTRIVAVRTLLLDAPDVAAFQRRFREMAVV